LSRGRLQLISHSLGRSQQPSLVMECRQVMSTPDRVRQAWRLSLSTLLATAGCAKPLPQVPPPAFAVAAPRAAPFIGCWLLEMARPLDELGLSDRLTVRLDTTVIASNGTAVGLQAVAVGGFQGRLALAESRLVWWVHAGTDTLELGMESLSGASWRLAGSGDSISGETRLFFDIGPVESVVGTVWARRAACEA
jgi:hypothetical protein